MADITDRESLEAWLATRPREDAVLLAARAALRTVPLLASAMEAIEASEKIILPTLRAVVGVWLVALSSTSRATVGAGVRAGADAAADTALARAPTVVVDAVNATRYAATAASGIIAPSSRLAATRAAEYASAAFAFADSAAGFSAGFSSSFSRKSVITASWQAMDADVKALENGAAPEYLAMARLWPEQMPKKVIVFWEALVKSLLDLDADWWVWTDWYEARLDGRPCDKALEEARVLIPDETWKQGSAAVNARIAELIEEHGIRATPVARPLTIDGAGNIATTAPAPRPDVPEGIGHASLVENACEKLREHSHYLRAQRRWDRFSALQRYLDRIDALLAEPSLRPDRLHDAFEAAAQAIPRLLAEDELPDAVETHELRSDLLNGASDLRHLYPDLAAMVAARRSLATPTLKPEQVEAFDRMLAAVEEIVARELKEELAEDVEAVREAVADPPPEAPKLPLPDGPLKARTYRLLAYLTRIKRLASVSGAELIKHLDKGVEAAKKIESYRKAAAAIEPYWQLVLRAIRELLSGGGGNGAM